MDTVKIKCAVLLTKVRENRAAHSAEAADARTEYRRLVTERLETMLEAARDGKDLMLNVGLQPPIDMTKDYDRVITMLEMTSAEEIELTDHQFDQYVMDNWHWKALAGATNAVYATSAKAR